jgi:hypothetical protein
MVLLFLIADLIENRAAQLSAMPEFTDSPVEEEGFELPVPPKTALFGIGVFHPSGRQNRVETDVLGPRGTGV